MIAKDVMLKRKVVYLKPDAIEVADFPELKQMKWSDMNDLQRKLVIERLRKVYEFFKFPKTLLYPVLTDVYAINFSTNTTKR